MALFGRKKKTTKKVTKSTGKKTKQTTAAKKQPAKGSQSAEAQAVLAKMKAKSDAGDCAFC